MHRSKHWLFLPMLNEFSILARRLGPQMALLALLQVGTTSNAWAQMIDVNLDSPPTSESSGGVYSGRLGRIVLDVRNGTPSNMFDHVTGAECWGGAGGCAKFYGSTSGGGVYRGLNPGPYSGGATQLNLRFLQKWNAAWVSGQGAQNLKGNYLTLGGSPFWTQEKSMAAIFGGFQMAQSYRGTLYRIHGNGQSCSSISNAGYEGIGCTSASSFGESVSQAGPFMFGDYTGQWVAVELELRSNGTFKIYLWTQDRVYSGLYMESRNGPTGAPGITGFSGMYFHDSGAASGSYVMVDEVVLSGSFIGPPPGFGSVAPNPPVDVTAN